MGNLKFCKGRSLIPKQVSLVITTDACNTGHKGWGPCRYIDSAIKMRLDNTAAVAAINNLESPCSPDLTAIAQDMWVRNPIILPSPCHLLLNQAEEAHPLVSIGSLQLAAWHLSSPDIRTRKFRQELPRWWELPENRAQSSPTTNAGPLGAIGLGAIGLGAIDPLRSSPI
uniref:Uncharacterized protein n=1 Tax=Strigamia maritima TaxID=126957 RepID=T1ISI6_STRMM